MKPERSSAGRRPPGDAGRTFLSDRSLELWRDPVAFIQHGIQEHGCRAFTTRLLLRPTVVLGENRAVRDLLQEPDTFQGGLRDLFMPLFGENLVFMDGDLARSTRSLLHELFSSEACSNYPEIATRVTARWADSLDVRHPLDLYAAFKRLSMDLNLAVFLGLERDRQPNRVSEVTEVATTHWHGLYALPVSVSVPMVASSAYKQALEAKDKLLDMVDGMLMHEEEQSAFIAALKRSVLDAETRRLHLLLCSSALVPKALASLLTSAVVISPLWKPRYVRADGTISDEDLDCVLLEVQRLYPPFIGGRRIATRDAQVSGFQIRKGQAVVYGTAAAQRDPAVFQDPDAFDPDRWRDRNKNDRDKLFCFGGGPRICIGEKMYQHILRTACRTFIAGFDWHLPSDWVPAWKHIPVARPTNLPALVVERRAGGGEQWQDAL